MSREEYEARRAEIFRQLADLKEQYIRENTDIAPGCMVMAAGIKCYLREYKVTNGGIYAILFKSKGSRQRVYVSANAKIEKI